MAYYIKSNYVIRLVTQDTEWIIRDRHWEDSLWKLSDPGHCEDKLENIYIIVWKKTWTLKWNLTVTQYQIDGLKQFY